jgi:hypothetical protein
VACGRRRVERRLGWLVAYQPFTAITAADSVSLQRPAVWDVRPGKFALTCSFAASGCKTCLSNHPLEDDYDGQGQLNNGLVALDQRGDQAEHGALTWRSMFPPVQSGT